MADAAAEYARALERTSNAAEHARLRLRLAECAQR
jgi:hypothetical protein